MQEDALTCFITVKRKTCFRWRWLWICTHYAYIQHLFKSGINISLLSAINNAHTNAYGYFQYFPKSNNQVKSTQSTGIYIMCIYIIPYTCTFYRGWHDRGSTGREGGRWVASLLALSWGVRAVTKARQGCSVCPAWPHHTHTHSSWGTTYKPLGSSQ